MQIAVGTLNKAKLEAVRKAMLVEQSAVIFPVDVPSGVSSQPFSDEETMLGAVNRSKKAAEFGEADAGIGLEGGIYEDSSGFYLTNWGALTDKTGKVFTAGGARILLPYEIGLHVKKGVELGIVMDSLFSAENIREKEGAVGIFTNGMVSRSEMFVHIVKLLMGQYYFHYNR
ncbi:DUF84 family protein [Bacillus lacus]|uniref:Probable inosine/xanthosine triphosphatase n=1 Tax=Metabacillus lacus TaxID=1983721 RepID=A0A7X2M052_9BACI|nr:DUF84 family protein [Metabacillus lacus]MRX72712.1 DUF84 family protein [Metabacillus lacus]